MQLYEKPARLVLLGLVVASFCALACISTKHAVAAYRAANIVPGVAVTSGCEEESLFAIWRVAHSQPVYGDTAAIPYASAYFNWLFYKSYGMVATITAKTRGDAAIPATGRMVTLTGALTGALLLGVLGWRLLQPSGSVPALAGAFLGVFCFLGPLPGWWICTVRPDLWGVAFEALGLLWFLFFQRNRPWIAILGAVFIFYAAWAMKPTFIQALLATGLYLVVQRRWLHAVALGVGSVALYVITLFALGPAYRHALMETATANDFFFSIAVANGQSAALRALPFIVLCLCVLGWPRSCSNSFAAEVARLGLIGFPLAFAMAFLSSAKMGAAPNYFLTPTLFLTLAALGLAANQAKLWPLILSIGTTLALELALLLGHGRLDLENESTAIAQRWHLWETAPEPRFSHDLRLNLPWLNPHSPPLVLAFNYPRNRALNRKFESDGVGGLISRGYFASLLLPDNTAKNYDGAALEHYQRGPSAAGFTLFLRQPISQNSPAHTEPSL